MTSPLLGILGLRAWCTEPLPLSPVTHFPSLGQILLLMGFSWRNGLWRTQVADRLVPEAGPYPHQEPGTTKVTQELSSSASHLALWGSVCSAWSSDPKFSFPLVLAKRSPLTLARRSQVK